MIFTCLAFFKSSPISPCSSWISGTMSSPVIPYNSTHPASLSKASTSLPTKMIWCWREGESSSTVWTQDSIIDSTSWRRYQKWRKKWVKLSVSPSRNILYWIVRINDSRTEKKKVMRKDRQVDKRGSTRSMSRIKSKHKTSGLRWGNSLKNSYC